MSASVYRQHLENYLKTLEIKADRVIDVGGGSNPVSKRVKSWDVGTYHIVDNELEKPAGHVDFLHDLNNISAPADLLMEQSYDLVFCLEVFDYIWNPVQAMATLSWLCKPGARLIITFPFIYPNHNPARLDMLRYTKYGAVKLLNYGNFAVDNLIPRTIDNVHIWREFLQSEGYRFKGALESGTTDDAGYIIEAHLKI